LGNFLSRLGKTDRNLAGFSFSDRCQLKVVAFALYAISHRSASHDWVGYTVVKPNKSKKSTARMAIASRIANVGPLFIICFVQLR
jgi:hypothetical protein